jgi:hypothetical protein
MMHITLLSMERTALHVMALYNLQCLQASEMLPLPLLLLTDEKPDMKKPDEKLRTMILLYYVCIQYFCDIFMVTAMHICTVIVIILLIINNNNDNHQE